MSRTLLVYPPFCTPAGPPFSITNIHAFLKGNLSEEHELLVLDLNIEFHKIKFPKHKEYYKGLSRSYDKDEYNRITEEYKQLTKGTYAASNTEVVEGRNPELFDEMLRQITSASPDIVAFSIVYSSQCFYTLALIKALNTLNIKTVIGGPAVSDKMRPHTTELKNELELLNFINGKEAEHDKLNFDSIPDFTIYDLAEYFTPEPVLPVRTSSACYYKQCAFCTHHHHADYFEFPIQKIKDIIVKSGQRRFFLVDDMIHKKRLLEIAETLRPLKVSWMCQLRPTKDLDRETLATLKEAGLDFIIWGVESASDRILNIMRKGTNSDDIKQVMNDAHAVGIRNGVFIMFGFPTETKEEFLMTIDFLKEHKEDIDLVSTSVFGLQKGTPIYAHPEEFRVTKIIEHQRTVLEPRIEYEVGEGLSHAEATLLRQRYKKTLESINRFPKTMNFFREHLLCLS
ncbi:MAG: B12-binding domain-containing radical SAM protein [Candidatus Woesearchaeota archaeon]